MGLALPAPTGQAPASSSHPTRRPLSNLLLLRTHFALCKSYADGIPGTRCSHLVSAQGEMRQAKEEALLGSSVQSQLAHIAQWGVCRVGDDLQSLHAQSERLQRLLSSGTQAKLPDGGAQLRGKIADLQRRIVSAAGSSTSTGAASMEPAQPEQPKQDGLPTGRRRASGICEPVGQDMRAGRPKSYQPKLQFLDSGGRLSGVARQPREPFAAQAQPGVIDISSPDEAAQQRPQASGLQWKENVQNTLGELGPGKPPADKVSGVATLKGLPKGLAAALSTPFPEKADDSREITHSQQLPLAAVPQGSEGELLHCRPHQASADMPTALLATSKGTAASNLAPMPGTAAPPQKAAARFPTNTQIRDQPLSGAHASLSGFSGKQSSGLPTQSSNPPTRVEQAKLSQVATVGDTIMSRRAREAVKGPAADELAALLNESHQLKLQLKDLLAVLHDRERLMSYPDNGREVISPKSFAYRGQS